VALTSYPEESEGPSLPSLQQVSVARIHHVDFGRVLPQVVEHERTDRSDGEPCPSHMRQGSFHQLRADATPAEARRHLGVHEGPDLVAWYHLEERYVVGVSQASFETVARLVEVHLDVPGWGVCHHHHSTQLLRVDNDPPLR